jgi:hypothetical protein
MQFLGGVIFLAGNGANVEIHDSTFQSNTAFYVGIEKYPELSSLPIPGGDMQQSSTWHRHFNAARIGFNYIQGSVSLC